MPEYSNENVREWMKTYHVVHDVVHPWNNPNLLLRNSNLSYIKEVLASARKIPENLIDKSFKEKISILEQTVKIGEERDKVIRP